MKTKREALEALALRALAAEERIDGATGLERACAIAELATIAAEARIVRARSDEEPAGTPVAIRRTP